MNKLETEEYAERQVRSNQKNSDSTSVKAHHTENSQIISDDEIESIGQVDSAYEIKGAKICPK